MTDAFSESAHSSSDSDLIFEKNERTLNDASSPALAISPRRKEANNTPGLPLIRSSSKVPVQQVIHVTIGRVEVRASFPPTEVKIPAPKETTGRMSLDQFLEQQKSPNR
jgi:hypothetical protein